jgi:hypothetical protein
MFSAFNTTLALAHNFYFFSPSVQTTAAAAWTVEEYAKSQSDIHTSFGFAMS